MPLETPVRAPRQRVRRPISARTIAQSDIQRARNANTADVPWLEHLHPFKSDGLLDAVLSYGRQCEPGFMLGRPNHAIPAKARAKGSIHTLVLETAAGRTGAVEPYLFDYKMKLLQAFDIAALAKALAHETR